MSDLSNPFLRAIWAALYPTPMGALMRDSWWAWPICESIHFTSMAVLVGIIGLFDLRLLGFARAVPILVLHRLIPVGVTAFAVNAVTGFFFLCAMPAQYLFNPAFGVKLVFIALAGLNVLVFYAGAFKRRGDLGPLESPPLSARVAGAVSLVAWIGVMAAGRLITFYRP